MEFLNTLLLLLLAAIFIGFKKRFFSILELGRWNSKCLCTDSNQIMLVRCAHIHMGVGWIGLSDCTTTKHWTTRYPFRSRWEIRKITVRKRALNPQSQEGFAHPTDPKINSKIRMSQTSTKKWFVQALTPFLFFFGDFELTVLPGIVWVIFGTVSLGFSRDMYFAQRRWLLFLDQIIASVEFQRRQGERQQQREC